VALAARELLEDDLGLTAFARTTGGDGLHVHVPLAARAGFDEVRGFARQVAEILAAREPDLGTVEQRKNKRVGKVYADVMRNAYGQTAVAPYSVRARPGAPVSAPLSWDEVSDLALLPGRFTMTAMTARLDQHDDIWPGYGRHRHSLTAAASRLSELAA
jgi:bifunctional non-homologous end joining protein LigD